jgi:predicted short-subunit dehydrogenase-like oxidoreductase (DUF2520 family)
MTDHTLKDQTLKDQTFGFIGCGRVGRTLARAFAAAGYNVNAAWSRKEADVALLVGEVPGIQAMPDAQAVVDISDVVWLTVSDDAIAPVADAVSWGARHRVIHCSGASDLTVLQAAGAAGAQTASFHPMQIFTNPAVALECLPGCTIGIEADDDLLRALQRLAEDIGCVSVQVPPGDRALYHVSGFIVGPLFIALMSESVRIWKRFGADEAQTLAALFPMVESILAAVRDAGLARGMGGPVARGDIGTVRKHLKALDAFDPEAGRIYRALTKRTIPLGIARGTLKPERAELIAAALDAD